MSTTDPDGHDCAWCPARRFPSRQALAVHERAHRLAEFATIPRDPLAVLREALISVEEPVLLDKFLEGALEVDVDAVADGETVRLVTRRGSAVAVAEIDDADVDKELQSLRERFGTLTDVDAQHRAQRRGHRGHDVGDAAE